MTPQLDSQMRAMPISTKDEAVAFMAAFRQYCWENNPYGMVLPKSHKPASVRCPDIFRKAREAEQVAEQCFWQMPWDMARIKFWGLPRAKWEEARRVRGLLNVETPCPISAAANREEAGVACRLHIQQAAP